jgi:hypothetical protein
MARTPGSRNPNQKLTLTAARWHGFRFVKARSRRGDPVAPDWHDTGSKWHLETIGGEPT